MKKTVLVMVFMLSLLLSGCCLRHEWNPATCTQPQICAKCGETQGNALGHSWADATCTQPQTCTVCGETQGDALGHSVSDWSVVTKPSYPEDGTEAGICTVCGEKIERTLPLSPEEKEAGFKADCTAYSYDELARDPNKYLGTNGKYTGEIIQVIEDGNEYQLRVNITKGRYSYTDTIYVTYTKKDGESRLLEDDIVTIYGTNFSTVSYTSVLGAKVTLPYVVASYIDRK